MTYEEVCAELACGKIKLQIHATFYPEHGLPIHRSRELKS